MGSPVVEEVVGQFEDAESDDDASSSIFFSKSAAPAPPDAAPPQVANAKRAFRQDSCSTAVATVHLPVPGSEPLRHEEYPPWPAVRPQCFADARRKTDLPRLVGGPTQRVTLAPHSSDSSAPAMKPQAVMLVVSPGEPGSAIPDLSTRSPFYRPIAPHVGNVEMTSTPAVGYRSSWLPNAVPVYLMHPGQPLTVNCSLARPSVRVLASSEADVERIEVERVAFPEVPAGAASPTNAPNAPDTAVRKASFKHVVLGLGSGETRSTLVGSTPPWSPSRPPAVVDAAHAMAELSRQSPASVPPPNACSSPALYLHMTHPHPSIAPSVPSRSNVDRTPVTPLPCPVVKSDFEAKTNPIYSLGERDVILGRGGQANHHPGNIWFRSVIQCYRMHYCVLLKGDKMQMARNLANWFYLAGARFLMHTDGGCWYEAGSDRATKKCSQSLREGTCAVVRKTLEGSILFGTDAMAGVGPVVGESHSNTVTPTSQIEQSDSNRTGTSTVTGNSQKPMSTSANASTGTRGGQRQPRQGKRDSGIHRGNWEKWRKRARESSS